MRVGLALAAGLLSGAGCFSSSTDESCRTDRDCGGDYVCTRVGECASTSSVYALRVEWTVHGLTTDQAGACSDVGDLELAITDPTTGGQHAVRPVPCIAGSFFFDRLPVGYTEVSMSVYGTGGGYLDSSRASAVGANGVVTLPLLPP